MPSKANPTKTKTTIDIFLLKGPCLCWNIISGMLFIFFLPPKSIYLKQNRILSRVVLPQILSLMEIPISQEYKDFQKIISRLVTRG